MQIIILILAIVISIVCLLLLKELDNVNERMIWFEELITKSKNKNDNK